MARLFKRVENIAKYTASTQSRIELSRNYHMTHLICRLEVIHDNTASASFFDNKLFKLINSIEIVANGNETLKQIQNTKLQLDNIIDSGMRGLHKIDESDGTDKKSFVYFKIDFSMPNALRPHDTILNTALFSTFDFLVNWGSDATVGTGITVKSATLEISSNSLVNYLRNKGETVKYYKETALVKEVTSSTHEMSITMPVKKLYRGISIIAFEDAGRSNKIIKKVTIKSGTTVFVDWSFDALQAENNFLLKPEDEGTLDGTVVIDFAQRGRLSDMLNTISSFNTLEVVLDVEKQAGTNKIYIFSDTVEDTNIVEVP